MQHKLVIGLVGEKGSGKETFGDLLQQLLPDKKIVRVRFSDLLVDTLNAWSLPLTRENLQDLAIVMRKGFGDNTLTHAVYQRINQTEADLIILDGIRWETDAVMLKALPHHLLVYITADLKIRFERLKKRGQKVYEESTSFEQFMHEENKLNELSIPKIGKSAAFKIDNNGTKQKFRQEVKKFLDLIY